MAAKSRKRSHKIENKPLDFDKLQLKDIICSICQSILLEPVTLPCYHNFCQSCFKSSIENNALCCPLCRLRIGSWLRTATKQNKIVNIKLWDSIKSKFSHEVDVKLKGEDLDLSPDQPMVCLSAPGEIRAEYETELKRLQAERLQLEQKQLQQTTLFIKQIQEEEAGAHKKNLARISSDTTLAEQIQKESCGKTACVKRLNKPIVLNKQRLKLSKIDSYLTKKPIPNYNIKIPLLTDESTNSTNSSDSIMPQSKFENRGSPEMVPSYSKFLKNKLEKKVRTVSEFWNKENGDSCKTKKTEILPHSNNLGSTEEGVADKIQTTPQSLPVSLPYTGILQHKINTLDKRSVGSGSVDSMRQELCYFKPVQGTTATSYNAKRGLPLRVPVIRLEKPPSLVPRESPTRMQYAEGLCLLRNLSLAQNLPSAFVIALNKNHSFKNELHSRTKAKPTTVTNPQNYSPAIVSQSTVIDSSKRSSHVDSSSKLNTESTLRRTRSMGSISKEDSETTPNKAKTKLRQVSSERKPYLRSESKKYHAKTEVSCPTLNQDSVNNNKINLAVKNLSSPLQHCDVKKIFEEQILIVKRMEQEKDDLELARKMDAELNGRMKLRRPPVKRHVPLSSTLRPAKKLKA